MHVRAPFCNITTSACKFLSAWENSFAGRQQRWLSLRVYNGSIKHVNGSDVMGLISFVCSVTSVNLFQTNFQSQKVNLDTVCQREIRQVIKTQPGACPSPRVLRRTRRPCSSVISGTPSQLLLQQLHISTQLWHGGSQWRREPSKDCSWISTAHCCPCCGAGIWETQHGNLLSFKKGVGKG